jgi:dipeptidyl aminopeptidase/acylaminoacyl peptidase
MIVDVHGGGAGSRLYLYAPLTVGVSRGPLEWHAWAALGYVVFVPDYRSTGDYGSEVITARYQAGEIDAIGDIEDIVSGTRHMMDQGFVDRSRVAILGHSAGGKRVYILLTQHDLYAAAILSESIPPDPLSNFINLATDEFTGGYPAGIYREFYGGELSDVPDRYKMNFMFDSYRNKTPTLIMVGNEALGGVDHMSNELLYSILKQHNVPTRMLKFVKEGHTYSRPESAKLAFEVVRRWLEVHMPNRRAASNRMAPTFRSANICSECSVKP